MQMIGSATYGSAQAASFPWLIMLGRLIAGCGSTNNAMAQKFVIQTSSIQERSKAIAILQVGKLVYELTLS